MTRNLLLFAILPLLFTPHTVVHATVDAETAEQVLAVLRAVFIDPVGIRVLTQMEKLGCAWHNEFVWYYSPKEISEGVYRMGGELVIQFYEEYSLEQSVSFAFSGTYSQSGGLIDSVTLLSSDDFGTNCR